MKSYFSLPFLFVLFAFQLSAQEVTVEHQAAALDYINKSQVLLNEINQLMLSQQEIHMNSQLSNAQKQEALKKNAAPLSGILNKIENLEILVHDEGIHEAVGDYAKFISLIFNKDKNNFYIKSASKELNCNNCLNARKLAYSNMKKDYVESDKLLEQLNDAYRKVAAMHLIEWEEEEVNQQDKIVDKVRAAVDHIYYINLAVTKAVSVFNNMGNAMQKTIENKQSSADLKKVIDNYHIELKECLDYFNTYKEEDRQFDGDNSVWTAASNILTALKNLDDNTLPELLEIAKAKDSGIAPNEKKTKKVTGDFYKINQNVKNFEVAQVTFLNKYYSQLSK